MNENIRSTNLRFNLEKDTQMRAWQYLHTMDKQHFKSYSNVIAMDTFLGKLEQQHITLSEQKEADKAQFLEIRDGITPESKDAVMAEREAIRPNGKVGLVQKLYAVYKDKYRSEIFDEANRQIDIELQEKPVLKKKRSLSEQLKVPHQDIQRSKKQKKKEYER